MAAPIAFWISRPLGRGPVGALVGKKGLEFAGRWFARRGQYAVSAAWLVPILSFDVIPFAAGLTRMGFWGFLLATTVGAAPATFVYTYLGARASRYVQVLLVAFGSAIVVALVVAIVRREKRDKPVP